MNVGMTITVKKGLLHLGIRRVPPTPSLVLISLEPENILGMGTPVRTLQGLQRWRKSIGCSRKGPMFGFQNPRGGSQPTASPRQHLLLAPEGITHT